MHCLMQCPSAISSAHLQKGFQVCVCFKHCGSSNPLSSTLSTSLALKTL